MKALAFSPDGLHRRHGTGLDLRRPARERVVETTHALDDAGERIRFRRWCRQCLALVWGEYENFAPGFGWEIHWFDGPGIEACRIEACPDCVKSPYGLIPLTELEVWERIHQAREASIGSRPLDAELVGVMNAELDLGLEFERLAGLYGWPNSQSLAAAISAWLLEPAA